MGDNSVGAFNKEERIIALTDAATDLVVRMHTINKVRRSPFVPKGKDREAMLVSELCALCIEANALMMQASAFAADLSGVPVRDLMTKMIGAPETDDE